jgi:hypothetical protein
MATLWEANVWRSMVTRLADVQAAGTIRPDVDAVVLARMVHHCHIGSLLTRFLT